MADNQFLEFFEEQIRKNDLQTLEEIADRVQLSTSTVSRIRSGKTPPSASAARQIAAAFGFTTEEAMGSDTPVCAGSELMKDLMNLFECRLSEVQGNMSAVRSELASALERIEEKDRQIEDLTKEKIRFRTWAVASSVALLVLLVTVIGILIYDFTHLDTGWFITKALHK